MLMESAARRLILKLGSQRGAVCFDPGWEATVCAWVRD